MNSDELKSIAQTALMSSGLLAGEWSGNDSVAHRRSMRAATALPIE
jgi:hypothetical protein